MVRTAFALAALLAAAPALALPADCPVGRDGKALITGPVRCLDGFQRDLLGIGPPSGELARHRANAERLLAGRPVRMRADRSEAVANLIARWHEIDRLCSTAPTVAAAGRACARRAALGDRLNARGWCYGQKTAAGVALRWGRCPR